MLNINDLCLKNVFPLCNMHRFVMRYGPFQGLKSTISCTNMGLIGLRNGLYHNVKLINSDYVIGYM